MEDRIAEIAGAAIEGHTFPGCVVGVVRKDGERLILPFGHFTYEPSSPAVRANSMYDTASITKSIPTGSLCLQMIDQGKLKVTDKLIDYVPEFNNSDRENVLIKHLLTYTIDGYGLASTLDGRDTIQSKTAEQLLHLLLTHDFEKRPGTVFKYTNIPAALLGLVIERLTGKTIDVLADEHFFVPLGMSRSTFYPEKFPIEEIPPTEIDSWRGEVRGAVHDESAYIAKRDGKIFGHAGLFSTAGDILSFLGMLLDGGTLSGKRFFSEDIIRHMETNQIPELNDFTGLGWELNQPRYMGKYCGEHTFGKTGFTGTLCVVDRQKGVAYAILSNRIYPKRAKDSSAINAFRAAIGEIILS
ncbi:beta-lactamase family protein [Candidatus Kaiserbacteria bacterium]|nr:beta-lactamase family protein [Candidatus Kaiserbacteria bacterium]